MADVIDQAQNYDELFRGIALRNYRDAIRNSTKLQSCSCNSTCCDCGEEIDPARLAANPHAQRCIDCQIKKERRERK